LHTNAAWQEDVIIPPKTGDTRDNLVVDIRSGDILETPVTVRLPKRAGKPAQVHVAGPIIEFDGIAQQPYVWTRYPISTSQGMIELPAQAALVDVWVEGDNVVGSLVLEAAVPSGPYHPIETAFPVRVPCSALELTSTSQGTRLPNLPWSLLLLTEEDIPPGTLQARKNSVRAFLRPAPRWNAPRTVLARWVETGPFAEVTEFHFHFQPKREQGDWLFVEYGMFASPIRVSGWIHRSVLEPAKHINSGVSDEPVGYGPAAWCYGCDYEGPARIAVGTQLLHPVTKKPWATVRSADGFTVVIDSKYGKTARVIGIPGVFLRGKSVEVPRSAVEWPAEDPYPPR